MNTAISLAQLAHEFLERLLVVTFAWYGYAIVLGSRRRGALLARIAPILAHASTSVHYSLTACVVRLDGSCSTPEVLVETTDSSDPKVFLLRLPNSPAVGNKTNIPTSPAAAR